MNWQWPATKFITSRIVLWEPHSDGVIIRWSPSTLNFLVPKVNLTLRKVYMYSKDHYADMDKYINNIDWYSLSARTLISCGNHSKEPTKRPWTSLFLSVWLNLVNAPLYPGSRTDMSRGRTEESQESPSRTQEERPKCSLPTTTQGSRRLLRTNDYIEAQIWSEDCQRSK